MSESIMNQYGVGQDEFIFRMYSIALVAIVGAAAVKGDLTAGIVWMLQPGTYEEQLQNVPIEDRSWSSAGKIAVMILFSSMGFFGSSCAAAITKQFGALSMSITVDRPSIRSLSTGRPRRSRTRISYPLPSAYVAPSTCIEKRPAEGFG